MIKACELRIGNWVNIEFVGPIQWEYTHFEDYVKDKAHGYDFEEAIISDKVEPIPLTPEILQKCGFVSYPEGYEDDPEFVEYLALYLDEDKSNQIVCKDNKFYVSGHYSPDFYGVEVDIKHLHQLQTLFYALCVKELEVNLTELALSAN